MPSYHAKALVLSKTKLKESDLILTLLAEDGSQIRAIARGMRKTRSRFAGTLEIFSVADLLVAQGHGLDVIAEASLLASNEACRNDLEHSMCASAACEFARKLSLEGQPQPRFFDMTVAALATMGKCDAGAAQLICAAYLMKAMSLLGYRPELDACISCGNEVPHAHLYSWRDAGVVCEACDKGVASDIGADAIGWARALISSTFAELAAAPGGSEAAARMLSFAARCLLENVDVRLKSLDMLLSAL